MWNSMYDKIVSVFGMVRDSADRKVNLSDIADDFSASASYAAGRLVVHDGSLYRCVQGHSGPWTSDDFVMSAVSEAIDAVSKRS